MTTALDTRHCLICQKKNATLHWHVNEENGDIWAWCCAEGRAYSIHSYCYEAGITLGEFLKLDFDFIEAPPNEVTKMEFPINYVPLGDPRAEEGVKYVHSRGLSLQGDFYYDIDKKGIVFPYYFHNVFVGAQTRFIEPRVFKSGDVQKMDTIPGTRLGLLFYGWNQAQFVGEVKVVIVTEGAFNALAIQQSLLNFYGGYSLCPFRAIACSGTSTKHHREALKELRDKGIKICVAGDMDEAGVQMLKKMVKDDAVDYAALTSEEGIDWNDELKNRGADFAKWFLGRFQRVSS